MGSQKQPFAQKGKLTVPSARKTKLAKRSKSAFSRNPTKGRSPTRKITHG